MSVPIKPYSVTVYPVPPTITANVVDNPTAGAAIGPIAVYIEAMTPRETYERFGVVLNDMYLLQCELADGASFTPNAEVNQVAIQGNFQYIVKGTPEFHDAGDAADHVDVYLMRLQYTDPNNPA